MQRTVRLLGDVRVDGVVVAGARLRALLATLALAHGRTVKTHRLVDAVWDGDAPEDPTGALQALVSRLRRATGLPVEAVTGGYRVPAGDVVVDALTLPGELALARRELAQGEPDAASTRLRALHAAWDGSPGAHLTAADAARLTSLHRDVQLLRVQAATQSADPEERAGVLADLGAAPGARPLDEPLDEPLAAAVLDLLTADGRASAALSHYEDLRAALDALGAQPSAQLRAAHARALAATDGRSDPAGADLTGADPAAAGRVGPPAVRSPGVGPAEQPAAPVGRSASLIPSPALEPLLGRSDDLAALSARVDAHVLVTLVGPGGVGKTSLVTALALQWHARGEPVHVAPLAGVRDAGDVAAVVAAVLRGARVRERDRFATGVSEELQRAAATTTGLLVLDNCEHVLDAVADVALTVAQATAGSTPGLRVVATSRAPLGVLGEQVHPVRPLDDAPALALVVRRALAVGAIGVDGAPTEELREICARLDNLPLALELAAARLRTMTPADLLCGLDDRFALLRAGARSLPERHRSLQALVDWSWDLLAGDERVLLRRMAVFPSGARTDTVVTVCAGGELSPTAIPAALAGLVDASLAVLEVDEHGRGRYRLLETIRQYAEARLDAQERDVVDARLAQWCTQLAVDLEPTLAGDGQVDALAVMGTERDTLAATLRWAVQHRRTDVALPVALVLAEAATLLGHHEAVPEWARLARSLPSPLDEPDTAGTPPAPGRRELVTAAATLDLLAVIGLSLAGNTREVAALARSLRRALGRRDLLPDALAHLVEAVVDLVHGRDVLQRGALTRLMEAPASRWQPIGMFARAWLHQNNGQPREALADALAAHDGLRRDGNIAMAGSAAGFVAERLAAAGDPAGSLPWWEAAEQAALAVGADGDARQARVFWLRTQVELAADDPDARAALRRQTADLAAAHPDDDFVRLLTVADAAAEAGDRGDWARARELFAAELERSQGARVVIPQVLAVLAVGVAVAEIHDGRLDAARTHLVRASGLARGSSDVPAQAMVAEAVALWCTATARPALAGELSALAQRFGSHLMGMLGGRRPAGLDPVVVDPDGTHVAAVMALGHTEAVAALHAAMARALGSDGEAGGADAGGVDAGGSDGGERHGPGEPQALRR